MYEKKVINPIYNSYSSEDKNPYKVLRGNSYYVYRRMSTTRDGLRLKCSGSKRGFRICLKRKQ